MKMSVLVLSQVYLSGLSVQEQHPRSHILPHFASRENGRLTARNLFSTDRSEAVVLMLFDCCMVLW